MLDRLLMLRRTQQTQLHRLLAVGAVVGGPDVRRGDGDAGFGRLAGLIPPEERRLGVPACRISSSSSAGGSGNGFRNASLDLLRLDTPITIDKPHTPIHLDGERLRVEIERHRGAEKHGALERMPRRGPFRVLQDIRRSEGGALRETDHAVEGALLLDDFVQQVEGSCYLGLSGQGVEGVVGAGVEG